MYGHTHTHTHTYTTVVDSSQSYRFMAENTS